MNSTTNTKQFTSTSTSTSTPNTHHLTPNTHHLTPNTHHPHRVLIVACVLIITGYLLMSGPASTEQAFNADIFSTRRIVIAPMLCLAGYLLIIVGILRKSSS